MNIAIAIFAVLSFLLLLIAVVGYLFSLAVKWPTARRRFKWTALSALGVFVACLVATPSPKENVAQRPPDKGADAAAQDTANVVRAPPPPAKPAYCADRAATYRLPECGLTEKEVREEEAAAGRRSKASQPTAKAPCTVSAAQFTALQTGMTYGQATATLGCAGEEASRTEFGKHLSITYTWRGDAFISNMTATFQNDVLVSKAQLGLR